MKTFNLYFKDYKMIEKQSENFEIENTIQELDKPEPNQIFTGLENGYSSHNYEVVSVNL